MNHDSVEMLKRQFRHAFVPETNRERALAQLWLEAERRAESYRSDADLYSRQKFREFTTGEMGQ